MIVPSALLLLGLIGTLLPSGIAAASGPQLSASPSVVAPGATVSVNGSGFTKNARGSVVLDGGAATASYRTNGKGSFSVQLAVPASEAAGSHPVAAKSDAGATLASSSILVDLGAPTAAPTAAPSATATATPAPTTTAPPAAAATLISGSTSGAVCGGKFMVTQSGSTQFLPLCASQSLNTVDTSIHRVIVVVHGDSRNAPDHMRYIVSAASAANVHDAVVIAPQFLVAEDLTTSSLQASSLYWTSGGWKQGDRSTTGTYARAWTISSFAVVDKLLAAVTAGQFPNLQEVVVVGHSAGGQFTERYVASNPTQPQLAGRGISMRYIVANPSSYLYFDAARFHVTTSTFTALSSTEQKSCTGYDTYKYGVQGLNGYAAAVGAATLKSQYAARTVTYLLGSLDTDTADASLDTSCAANWQGAQRFERGQRHFSYLATVFGATVYLNHAVNVVSGVGHDASKIYNSSVGQAALFGAGG